ncbi:MAG: Flp pilus assembly protein CpaB [Actinomycetota bacterium]
MFTRRVSRISKLFAVLAIVSAAAAFVLVRSYVARYDALRPLAGTPIPVLVASADLQRGAAVGIGDVTETQLPSSFAPPGAVRDVGRIEGRTLLTDLVSGEPVTESRLAPEGVGPVAALVPPELRAVTVPSSLPSGALQPGDLVDVLATFGTGRPHTETVATGLEVLLSLDDGQSASLGSAAEPETSVPTTGTVTAAGPTLVLLVSPTDAERLAYAQAFAEISVAIAGAA